MYCRLLQESELHLLIEGELPVLHVATDWRCFGAVIVYRPLKDSTCFTTGPSTMVDCAPCLELNQHMANRYFWSLQLFFLKFGAMKGASALRQQKHGWKHTSLISRLMCCSTLRNVAKSKCSTSMPLVALPWFAFCEVLPVAGFPIGFWENCWHDRSLSVFAVSAFTVFR